MMTNNSFFPKAVLTLMTGLICNIAFSQTLVSGQQNAGRIPTPTMLFMNVTPDPRSAGMGDAGAAISSDVNAIYWNPAKLATSEKDLGFAISYTPWLRNLVTDMAIHNVSGYKKTSKDQAFGFSLNYFDQGVIQGTDKNANSTGNFNAKEYSITGSYSKKLSNILSLGVNLKYINSNLLGNFQTAFVTMKPAQTVAADVALYWNSNSTKNWKNTYGLVLSNISGKVSYGGIEKNFIPTNLRFGVATNREFSDGNRLTFTLDLNKLMVPTPGIYDEKTKKYTKGTDPNDVTAIGGIFTSLFDAPDGLSEELQEISTSLGAEYLMSNALALRAGFFNESAMKGNRKYLTFGVGFKLDQKYGFDFAYLVPVESNNPLSNSLRFSLIGAINNGGSKSK
jgi:hypothetical protein